MAIKLEEGKALMAISGETFLLLPLGTDKSFILNNI